MPASSPASNPRASGPLGERYRSASACRFARMKCWYRILFQSPSNRDSGHQPPGRPSPTATTVPGDCGKLSWNSPGTLLELSRPKLEVGATSLILEFATVVLNVITCQESEDDEIGVELPLVLLQDLQLLHRAIRGESEVQNLDLKRRQDSTPVQLRLQLLGDAIGNRDLWRFDVRVSQHGNPVDTGGLGW